MVVSLMDDLALNFERSVLKPTVEQTCLWITASTGKLDIRLNQWFPNGVPQHLRMMQRTYRGCCEMSLAASFSSPGCHHHGTVPPKVMVHGTAIKKGTVTMVSLGPIGLNRQ